jgi:CRP-like cAMP-binding protein
VPGRESFGNRILDLLPASEADAVAPLLQRATLEHGSLIYRSGEDLTRVYFPISCCLSAVTIMQDGVGVEIGTIGREGIGGVQAALGVMRIPSEMVCQISGDTLYMSVEAFVDSVNELPKLRRVVQYYTQSMMNFMAQSVACNRLHNLTERSARWLLMTRDRVGGNAFYLTQEYLAYMLGVRRSGVTIAAGILQQAGMIDFKRGNIKILDTVGLESVACECYRIVVDEFERLLALA